jgi:hypothetical protein
LKVPLAIIDGVVLGCDWAVVEPVGPSFDVGVNESPQAASRNMKRIKIGMYIKRFILYVSCFGFLVDDEQVPLIVIRWEVIAY